MKSISRCWWLLFFFQEKGVIEIEKQLNGDFTNICEWFVDNKLSIYFDEDKTKSVLFSSKRKIKKVPKLNINYKNMQRKQHSKVTYLCCVLVETISGESMGLKVINKINLMLNPLSANFTKWSNTLKQIVGKLPTNCLSVFDHFMWLALKGLNFCIGKTTPALCRL